MRVVIHHTIFGNDVGMKAVNVAIANERLHHRTNEPPYHPEPLDFEVDYVGCEGPHDYGDSLKRLWEKGEGFINLEHDVAPWPGALTALWECAEPWCALPLIVGGCENQTNFGCCKFSSEFLAETKGIWDDYPRNKVFDWRSLDSWFYDQMRGTSETVQPSPRARTHHTHRPAAIHFNWRYL